MKKYPTLPADNRLSRAASALAVYCRACNLADEIEHELPTVRRNHYRADLIADSFGFACAAEVLALITARTSERWVHCSVFATLDMELAEQVDAAQLRFGRGN